MTNEALQEILDSFTRKLREGLDEDKLEGSLRVNPTRAFVIIPVKGKGPIHVPIHQHVDDTGVESVLRQLRLVPSLKSLVRQDQI